MGEGNGSIQQLMLATFACVSSPSRAPCIEFPPQSQRHLCAGPVRWKTTGDEVVRVARIGVPA